MRGSRHGLSDIGHQQPRQVRLSNAVATSREPVTSQVTTALGNGSRNQTSSDGPNTSISANPTQRDLIRRTDSPLHGRAADESGTFPAASGHRVGYPQVRRTQASEYVAMFHLPAGR